VINILKRQFQLTRVKVKIKITSNKIIKKIDIDVV